MIAIDGKANYTENQKYYEANDSGSGVARILEKNCEQEGTSETWLGKVN
jgi:hypothetical protein